MMRTAIVTGGAAGLGKCIVDALSKSALGIGHDIWTTIYDKKDGYDVITPHYPPADDVINYANKKGLDFLINNAALNRPAWFEDSTEENWDAVMDVNVKGIYMMTKALLPGLTKKGGTVLNIVSNASHLPMRCSAAYNASKGAAHILTLQLARELGPKLGLTIFGISPNKLAGTEMSKEIEENVLKLRGWTPEFAKEYQLASLPAGVETPPERLAEFIAFLLSHHERHRYLHGTIIPYGV